MNRWVEDVCDRLDRNTFSIIGLIKHDVMDGIVI